MKQIATEVAASRRAQGLDPVVTDPDAVRRIVAILRSGRRRRG